MAMAGGKQGQAFAVFVWRKNAKNWMNSPLHLKIAVPEFMHGQIMTCSLGNDSDKPSSRNGVNNLVHTDMLVHPGLFSETVMMSWGRIRGTKYKACFSDLN